MPNTYRLIFYQIGPFILPQRLMLCKTSTPPAAPPPFLYCVAVPYSPSSFPRTILQLIYVMHKGNLVHGCGLVSTSWLWETTPLQNEGLISRSQTAAFESIHQFLDIRELLFPAFQHKRISLSLDPELLVACGIACLEILVHTSSKGESKWWT